MDMPFEDALQQERSKEDAEEEADKRQNQSEDDQQGECALTNPFDSTAFARALAQRQVARARGGASSTAVAAVGSVVASDPVRCNNARHSKH